MSDVQNLQDLFEAQLKDIYYAENKILKALPKMQKKASNAKLAAAFKKHETETVTQIEKLERVMTSLGMKVKGEKCDAIEGIIKEAESIMKECSNEAVRDAGMIAAAQKVEHYEIATYGTLVCYAEGLGHKAEAKLLQSILDQERKTDEALTTLAESGINDMAETADQEEAA
jgi:ferritin-like metal-binding protein YciE